MTEFKAWRTLKDGAEDDLVLAVDFYSPGRPEAAFSDAAPHLGGPYAIWETMQPAPGTEGGMTGEDYLDRWVDALPAGARVRGVMGFCVGGVYASALGERIAQRQGGYPPIVMVDPEPVVPIVLYWQYHKLLDKMAGVLTPDEVAQAKITGHQAQEAAEDAADLADLGSTLVKLYRDVADVGLGRLGLNSARRDEMMSWFDSYVSYLVGASQVVTAADVSTSTVISSDAPAGGMHLAGAEIPFDIDRHDLLRRPEVAAAVAELFA